MSLCYRLQMAALIRAVPGEPVEAKIVESLRFIVETAGVILSQERGHVVTQVQNVGGTLCVTHMDGERIPSCFYGRCKVESAEMFEKIARKGVPPEIRGGGSLDNELVYRNHRSALEYGREVLKKVATDVSMDRSIVFSVTFIYEIKGCGFHQLGW